MARRKFHCPPPPPQWRFFICCFHQIPINLLPNLLCHLALLLPVFHCFWAVNICSYLFLELLHKSCVIQVAYPGTIWLEWCIQLVPVKPFELHPAPAHPLLFWATLLLVRLLSLSDLGVNIHSAIAPYRDILPSNCEGQTGYQHVVWLGWLYNVRMPIRVLLVHHIPVPKGVYV